MLFVRALVNSLFGPHILAAAPNFPEEYIRFQDDYEETIAKSITLPAMLAKPMLGRIAASRQQLSRVFLQEIRRQRNSSSKTPKTYLRELIQIAAVKSISDERI